MTIVGYDDEMTYTSPSGQTIKGAFKLANSWGTGARYHDGVYLVAADANQDGNVNNLDSALILKYDAGLENIDQILENIDQILENAEISNEIYFGDSVKF